MTSPAQASPVTGVSRTPELGLDIKLNSKDVGVAMRLVGELDVATTPWFLDRMRATLTPADRAVSLDLSELTFLDVAGVRALVALGDSVNHAHGTLEITGLRGAPLQTARLLGLDMSRED